MRNDVTAAPRKFSLRPAWTGAENILVAKLYPSAPWTDICNAIPRHHQSAIAKQANALGLRRDKALKRSPHSIIRELRKIRRQNGIHQVDFAEVLGAHSIQIAKWERGEQRPRLLTFFDWVQALGYELKLVRARDAERLSPDLKASQQPTVPE